MNAAAEIPFSVHRRFVVAVPPLLSSEDVMRGKGKVLRDVEEGTRYLIQYQTGRGPQRGGGLEERLV